MPRRSAFLPWLVVAIVIWFGGCVPGPGVLEKVADDAKEQTARRYLERLAAGDLAALIEELDPALRNSSTREQFEKMRQAFPEGAPAVANLVGYQVTHSERGTVNNLVYQFGYGSKWVFAHVAWVERPAGAPLILGMSARALREPLQERHALSFKRANKRHYVFALAAIAIPLFCLTTLIVSFRTPIPRGKWLWRVFICLGFVACAINWSTGDVVLKPFSVLLFGAGAMTPSIYAPWTVVVAIPVGAILFWIRRRRWTASPSLAAARTPSPSGPPAA